MPVLYQLTKDIPEMGLKKGAKIYVSDIKGHVYADSLKLFVPEKKKTAKKKAEVKQDAN